MNTVYWSYWHWMGRTRTRITKKGEFFGQVKHTARYTGPQMSVVVFEGNKRASRVPYSELTFANKSK